MGEIAQVYRAKTGRNWLYNIVHVDNVNSVLTHGILSHEQALALPHRDISNPAVQDKRDKLIREGGKSRLRQYANLYFDARNPMMYYLMKQMRNSYQCICVLFVSYDVLKLPGTLVTDMNAASGYARFLNPRDGVESLVFEHIMAGDWTDGNAARQAILKSRKCAEVLVYGRVEPEYIRAIATHSSFLSEAQTRVSHDLPVVADDRLFFG